MASRIAGQAPSLQWKRNVGRAKRTIDEAVAIARRHGVEIPDDVVFFVADQGHLAGSLEDLFAGKGMQTARGPEVYEHADGYIYWNDHYNRFGEIPFHIHPEILTSDEAIVAVFAHEMHELTQLRAVFLRSKKKRMDAADYGRQVAVGHRGNFHDEAWTVADRAVQRMRGATHL